MADSIYITRVEYTRQQKMIDAIYEWIKVQAQQNKKSLWVKPLEAMELLGCKATKLRELRRTGQLDWKTTGRRNVMISRKSIEDYNLRNSTLRKIIT